MIENKLLCENLKEIKCSDQKLQEKSTYFITLRMHPKDADQMASSVDPEQTAPPGQTYSLSAQSCLS